MRFASECMKPSTYEGTRVFVCVYDITSTESLTSLKSQIRWVENVLDENGWEGANWVFVGNKLDTPDDRREVAKIQV